MGLPLRRQGRAPSFQGNSQDGRRFERRSVPQPRRRTAPRRRLREGYHAIQRIPVGGFPAAEIVAQERGSRFRKGDREGAGFGKEQGRYLSAGVVRTRLGRLGAARSAACLAAKPNLWISPRGSLCRLVFGAAIARS